MQMLRMLRIALALPLLLVLKAFPLIVYQGKIVDAWPDAPASTALPKGAAGAAAHYYPHPAGEVWGLTLLVDFSDTPPAFTKDEVDAWLNQKGFNRFGCNGSVRDYYADVSRGKVDFRNEIHGYYRAKNPKAYYESGTGYEHAGELVDELLAHFDPEVDFSKFDNDNDGRVEAISIVYAGKGETWGQGLWPHAGGINQKRDNVQLTRYMMTDLGTSLSLYVFCHECGHMVFGWPDLYGFGDYCLMGNRPNDANPPAINDFYRADQGWIDVVDLDKNSGAAFLAPSDGSRGYRFANPARPQECFFWSNIANTGRHSVLKGRGLLVLHFDKDIGVNTPPNPLSLAVVQADGKDELGQTMWPSPGSDAKDFFTRTTGAAFGSATSPAAKWNNGAASGLDLHDIGPATDSLAFAIGRIPVALFPAARAGLAERRPSASRAFDARGVRGSRAAGPRLAR
jgi:M6 family metalloprotease-like protein